jgi:hypothetical protein
MSLQNALIGAWQGTSFGFPAAVSLNEDGTTIFLGFNGSWTANENTITIMGIMGVPKVYSYELSPNLTELKINGDSLQLVLQRTSNINVEPPQSSSQPSPNANPIRRIPPPIPKHLLEQMSQEPIPSVSRESQQTPTVTQEHVAQDRTNQKKSRSSLITGFLSAVKNYAELYNTLHKQKMEQQQEQEYNQQQFVAKHTPQTQEERMRQIVSSPTLQVADQLAYAEWGSAYDILQGHNIAIPEHTNISPSKYYDKSLGVSVEFPAAWKYFTTEDPMLIVAASDIEPGFIRVRFVNSIDLVACKEELDDGVEIDELLFKPFIKFKTANENGKYNRKCCFFASLVEESRNMVMPWMGIVSTYGTCCIVTGWSENEESAYQNMQQRMYTVASSIEFDTRKFGGSQALVGQFRQFDSQTEFRQTYGCYTTLTLAGNGRFSRRYQSNVAVTYAGISASSARDEKEEGRWAAEGNDYNGIITFYYDTGETLRQEYRSLEGKAAYLIGSKRFYVCYNCFSF